MITPDEHSCILVVGIGVVHMVIVRRRGAVGHKGVAGREEVVARMEVAGHIAVVVQLHTEDFGGAEVAEDDYIVLPVGHRVEVVRMHPGLEIAGAGRVEGGKVQPDTRVGQRIEGTVHSAGPPEMLDNDDQP